MAGTLDPTKAVKGAGTTFWRLNDGETIDLVDDYFQNTKWTQLAGVREIQGAELTCEDEEDNYLDDPESDWAKTSPGQKSSGESTITLVWKPGEAGQQQLVTDFENGVIGTYRVMFPNGVPDIYPGYINSLGKAVAIKEKITRTVKIKNVGKPITAEDALIEQAAAGV
ncbi:phage tail tube protein [Vibrio natriegens]